MTERYQMPSPETCLTYASILLKPRRVEFKPGIWHLQPPGEICQAAAEALRIYAATKTEEHP